MKFMDELGCYDNKDVSTLSLLMVYYGDEAMHTMQLYVKVEDVVPQTTGGTHVSHPKFQKVVTNNEFTLQQALENILGGDLTHYEIVGPGSWVTWSTLAKELRGQQLSLRYHNSPVPHTMYTLYGMVEGDTELKHPITIQPNIPTNIPSPADEETKLKQFEDSEIDHTCIENLKYPSSDSNNQTCSNNSLDKDSMKSEYGLPDSVMPEGPSKTFSHLTMDTLDHEFTLDSQTRAKVAISRENTQGQAEEGKVLRDKILNADSFDDEDDLKKPSKTDLQSVNPLSALSHNVPHLSLLQQSMASNVTDTTSIQQTECKVFESSSAFECPEKQNNLNCIPGCGNSNLYFVPNTLSEQTVPKYVNSVASKLSSSVTSEGNLPHFVLQGEMLVDTAVNSDSMSSVKSVESERNFPMSFVDTGQAAASSLFNHDRDVQHINVDDCQMDMEYVPHTCIQSVTGPTSTISSPRNISQVPVSSPDSNLPRPCESPGQVRTPPQKRHKLGSVPSSTSSGSLSPQQQLQLQHQYEQKLLWRKQSYEQQRLEQHQQQLLQQMPTWQQDILFNAEQSYPSPMDSEERTFQPHQQYPPQQQQQHFQQQQEFFSSPVNVVQSQQTPLHQGSPMNHAVQACLCGIPVTQSGHSHHCHIHTQQHHQPELDTQQQAQTNLKLPPQQSLLCHTPPSSFPEMEVGGVLQGNRSRSNSGPAMLPSPSRGNMMRPSPPHTLSVAPQQLSPQLPFNNNLATHHKTPPGPSHSSVNPTMSHQGPMGHIFMSQAGRLSPQTSSSTNQYLSMHQPQGSPQMVRTQLQINHPRGQSLPDTSLPGVEFRVRLPQPSQRNIGPDQPRITMNIVNDSNGNPGRPSGAASVLGGSGGRGNNVAVTAGHGSNMVIQSPPTTAQPFRPAPPAANILGRSTSSHSSSSSLSQWGEGATGGRRERSEDESSIDDDEQRYNYIDNSQVTRGRSRVNIERELSVLEGWCETENGDTIVDTMKKYTSQNRSHDGAFIIWKSRRHSKFIITVSHQNELFHYRIEESRGEDGRIMFYVFERGFRSDSLLELVRHYRQDGIPTPVQSANGKCHNEIIRLRCPLKVRVEKKKKDSHSSKK